MSTRVLIISDAWHPQVNGVVRVFDSVIPLLEAEGRTVQVLHPGLFRTIPLPFYPEIRLALFPRSRLRIMIRAFDPDVVHIATEGPLGWAARAICRAAGLQFTTSYHTHFQLHLEARGGGMLSPFVYAFLRRFHRAAARTMVATESLKRDLESHGFERVVVWPLGVDTKLFKKSNASRPDDLAHPVFVYFGRVATEKNIEEFLELDLPGTKMVIGDGPNLQQMRKKYGASVHFVGYKHGQELVDHLSQADVFVFPSRTETFGLVILEALACEIPVAAHACSGPLDIITHGVDGYLDEDLKKAALACLALDRRKCRETASRYSWDHSASIFSAHLAPVSRKL